MCLPCSLSVARSAAAATEVALPWPFGGGLFERSEGAAHGLLGFFAQFGRDLRSLGLGGALGPRGGLARQAACGAQFFGPHGHGRQRRLRIFGGGNSLRERSLEGIPHREQLRARGFEQRRKARFHARPARIARELLGLRLPACDVGAQLLERGLRIAPGLGREHFDALREQHRGLALHLHAVLQVFDHLDALGQLRLERGKRLARQRRARLGSVALPGQGVGDVELGCGQQRLGFFGPFGGNGLLRLGTADFIEPLAHRTRGPFVARAELLEHFLQLLGRGLGGQPLADARSAFAGCGGREGSAGQCIERMRLSGSWPGPGSRSGASDILLAGKKRKHESNRSGKHRRPSAAGKCRQGR